MSNFLESLFFTMSNAFTVLLNINKSSMYKTRNMAFAVPIATT